MLRYDRERWEGPYPGISPVIERGRKSSRAYVGSQTPQLSSKGVEERLGIYLVAQAYEHVYL